jgi:hypothetical protein
MHPNRILPASPAAIGERLTVEDDRELWEEVLRVVAEDASVLLVQDRGSRLYATVGVCSHWIRPHPSRWTAAGGFALLVGYGDGEGSSGDSQISTGASFCNSTLLSPAGLVRNKHRPRGSIQFGSPFPREQRAIAKRPCMPLGLEGRWIRETRGSSTTDSGSRERVGSS